MKIRTKYRSALRYLCHDSRKTWEMKKEISQKLKEQNCIYINSSLPISLMPVLLTQRELSKIAHVAENTSKLINKTLKACFASPRLKDYLTMDIIPSEWVQEAHFKDLVHIQRIDIVYNGKDIKVIGVECDAPRGYSWTDLVRITFANHPFYEKLIHYPQEEKSKQLLSYLKDFVLKVNKSKPQNEALNVAFVDYKESHFITDLQLACRFFINNGIKAFIADPRDFIIKNNKAYVNDAHVDIVIRGLKTKELVKHLDKIQNFIDAYNNNMFQMMNPLYAAYASEKSLFSLMTNPDFNHIFSEQDLQHINKNLCWTRCLSEQNTFYGKQAIDLKDFVKKYRENLVLKPASGDTHQVHVGIALEQPRWDGIVNSYMGRNDWIVQQYIALPMITQPQFTKGKVYPEKCYFTFSAFVVDGQFQTLLGRCSVNHAINLEKEGTVIPIFKYNEKESSIKKAYIS